MRVGVTPWGIAVDSRRRVLHIVCEADSALWRLHLDTLEPIAPPARLGAMPRCVAVDPLTGDVLVAHRRERRMPVFKWQSGESIASAETAAEFLYLMAKAVEGSQTVEAQPLAVFPPVAPREQRFDDPLSLLQMWILKPAYFARAGGRLQRATSVEVNLRGGRMQRDNEMRLLRPEDRPPW